MIEWDDKLHRIISVFLHLLILPCTCQLKTDVEDQMITVLQPIRLQTESSPPTWLPKLPKHMDTEKHKWINVKDIEINL